MATTPKSSTTKAASKAKTTARKAPTKRAPAKRTSASKPTTAKTTTTTTATPKTGTTTTATPKTATPKTATPKTATTKAATPPAAQAVAKRATTTVASATTPAPSATIVEDKPVVAGPMLRKVDFIDSVVTRTGMKKKDVKPVVEAAMALLGDAIEDGRDINLPELGKLKVNREKEISGAKVMICKLRRNKPAGGRPKGPLAKAAE